MKEGNTDGDKYRKKKGRKERLKEEGKTGKTSVGLSPGG